MKTFYLRHNGKLFPILGVTSIDELILLNDRRYLIQSDERVFMNPNTGSVDIESSWDSHEGLIEVVWNNKTSTWVEA